MKILNLKQWNTHYNAVDYFYYALRYLHHHNTITSYLSIYLYNININS